MQRALRAPSPSNPFPLSRVTQIATTWSVSPLGAMPDGEARIGPVMECTLRDSDSKALVPVQLSLPSGPDDPIPVQFRIALGTSGGL